MKFRVERDVLADAVAWAARALPIRPSAPVLAGLLIEAGPLDDGEGLQLSTFDYETSARATLNADVADEGRALVSGRLLSDIAGRLPQREIVVEETDATVKVTCGSAKFTLLKVPIEEYPTLPEVAGRTGVVPGSDFAEAVAQVAVALLAPGRVVPALRVDDQRAGNRLIVDPPPADCGRPGSGRLLRLEQDAMVGRGVGGRRGTDRLLRIRRPLRHAGAPDGGGNQHRAARGVHSGSP